MIEVTTLSKHYGRTKAVDNLSFTVPPGQVTGFLGPNGAGKSTTMRMMLGLDTPSAGSVTVNGRRYQDIPRPLDEVGAMLDAGAMHGGRSAYNNLRCLALSNGISRDRVEQVLQLVGLAGVARRRCGGFSLGMAQRLGIAAALLGDPPVLILDEPVNGLDPDGVLWIRGLLRSLAAEGRTVLLSSHLMSEMALTADRLVVIGGGRLISEAALPDFLDASTANYVLVRCRAADTLAALLRASGATVEIVAEDTLHVVGATTDTIGELASTNGLSLQELAVHQVSLEQRYLELTRASTSYRGGES